MYANCLLTTTLLMWCFAIMFWNMWNRTKKPCKNCTDSKKGGFGIFHAHVLPTEKHLEDPSITSEADRIKHYGQYDHVRLYGQIISKN